MVFPLKLERYRKVVVLTGAGISAASGLPTFRGPEGLWTRDDGPGRAGLNAQSLADDPAKVWSFFAGLRATALTATPNAAHLALAKAERSVSADTSLTIITQNVDGLHQRAGSKGVLELHGSLFQTRCASATCKSEPFEDTSTDPHLPSCPVCHAALRPDIVLFDEPLPARPEWLAKGALRDCDLFVAVGTSGTVSPASNFVRAAEFARARTVLVNLEPMSPRNPAYDEEILGRAEDLLPILFALDAASPDSADQET